MIKDKRIFADGPEPPGPSTEPVLSGNQVVSILGVDASGDFALTVLSTNFLITTGTLTIVPDFADNVFRISDNGDPTKKIAFEVSGVGAGTVRTITMPDSNVNLGNIAPTQGGTGIQTYTQGDMLYASAANTLAKLAKNTTATRYLSNTGTNNDPAWAQVNLTNGVTGVLPVANSSANIKAFAIKNTDSSHTGGLTEAVVYNLSIPANTLGANDTLKFEAMLFKTGTSGNAVFKAYIGTNPGVVGSGLPGGQTQIGQAQFGATQLIGGFTRKIANKNSQSTNNSYPAAVSSFDDNTVQTTGRTAINANFANQLYFFITVTLGAAGDVAGTDNLAVYIITS